MRKTLILVATVVAIALSSCTDKVIFDEKHNMSNGTWMRFEPETFEVEVKNVKDCYNIYFTLMVDTNVLKLSNVPLVVNLKDEEGSSRVFMSDVILKSKDGKITGNAVGDFVEYTAKAREYFYFNHPGIHQFEIKNATQYYELKGIASFGLKIEKSNMDINIE
ncbi:MAG: hypothetical protein IKY43_00085 [Bacteroidales bacterium]|nr:hypothetical protein [Bacteroidales bacterium]